MIRALALCLLCGPASAQDSATFCEGLGRVSIAADGGGYIVIINNPFCADRWNDGLDVIPVEVEGVRVVVQFWSSPGRTPDTAVILPPAGWISIPPELTLEEYQSGAVRIWPEGLS